MQLQIVETFEGENVRGSIESGQRNSKARIGGPKFCGENFRGWLSNHEIHESFLPR
jgi:hypothetical protein